MLVTVVAILCSLTLQGSCVEEIVTDSNMDPGVTFQSLSTILAGDSIVGSAYLAHTRFAVEHE